MGVLDWLGRRRDGAVEWFNDAVEITAKTPAIAYVARQIDPSVAGHEYKTKAERDAEAANYKYNQIMKNKASTPEQKNQALVDAHEANAQMQKKAGDYENAAIDLATLPAAYLGAGGSGSKVLASKPWLIRAPIRFAVDGTKLAAADLSLREVAHHDFNQGPGPALTHSLGGTLTNLVAPGTFKPTAVQLAEADQAAAILVQGVKAGGEAKIKEKLIKNGGSELALADLALDPDNPGVLTPKAREIIEKKLNDRELSDGFFQGLEQKGIVFNGTMRVTNFQGAVSTSNQPKPDFWSGDVGEIFNRVVGWIGDQFSGISDWVKNLEIFGGSTSPVTTVAMVSMGNPASFGSSQPIEVPRVPGGPGAQLTP